MAMTAKRPYASPERPGRIPAGGPFPSDAALAGLRGHLNGRLHAEIYGRLPVLW